MNFPCLRGPRGAIFSYPVCRACHVNLPPAACCVDDLHATPKRPDFILPSTSGTAEVATFEVRRLCLPAIAHVSLPTCDPVFSPAVFRIRSAGCSTEASMMQLLRKLSSATAT